MFVTIYSYRIIKCKAYIKQVCYQTHLTDFGEKIPTNVKNYYTF